MQRTDAYTNVRTKARRTDPKFALSLLAAFAATAAGAQTAPAPATAAASAAAPLLPAAGLVYRYWPMQLVQFVGAELPYSMIVLDVDDRGKAPVYDVALTERATGKQIHYVNQPELLAEDKARGGDAYLVRMQFDAPAAPAKEAQYLLRFNNEKEQPVLWQFVQGTDISEQGSGLSPIEAPIPIFMYREQGALAGEGTALKIGAITSTADVWKEYAQPPYFVPYHGAISAGVHLLTMAPVSSSWTVAQPAVTDGATWTLRSALGTELTAHAMGGKSAGAVKFDDVRHGTTMTVDAQQAGSGWTTSRVRFGPTGGKLEHTVSMSFSPALAPGATSQFDLLVGKKTKLAAGTVETSAGDGGSVTEKWLVSAPDWAKGKAATASAAVQPATATAAAGH